MKFQKGTSGCPSGRPKGIADKRVEFRKLLESNAKAFVEEVIELALENDVNALRHCIERLIPKIKKETIKFSMPELDLTKAQSLIVIGSAILEAVANGDIAPEHACYIADLIEGQRKAIETSELDARVTEIEHTFNYEKKWRNKMLKLKETNYTQFNVQERLNLTIAALSRHDTEEARRLYKA